MSKIKSKVISITSIITIFISIGISSANYMAKIPLELNEGGGLPNNTIVFKGKVPSIEDIIPDVEEEDKIPDGWYMDVNGTVYCRGIDAGETHKFEKDPRTFFSADDKYSAAGDANNACTSNITDMSGNYYDGSVLGNFFNEDISHWDVSSVTNMDFMFFNVNTFNQDIYNWDVSNVTGMEGMFAYAKEFNQDISNWDVSSVTGMEGMFAYAEVFNQDLSGWCVSNILSKPDVFDEDTNNWVLPKPSWGDCLPKGPLFKLKDGVLPNMIVNTPYEFIVPENWLIINDLGENFNINNVTYTLNPTGSAVGLFEIDGRKITGQVSEKGEYTLELTAHHGSLDSNTIILNAVTVIGDWSIDGDGIVHCLGAPEGEEFDFNGKTYISAHSKPFAVENADRACTSNMTDMSYMQWGDIEYGITINGDITHWDTANVTNMAEMFISVSSFDQDISNWNTSNVVNMNSMFQGARDFNKPIGKWDVSSVTDMSGMFEYAVSFNQPLSNWDVSNVRYMSGLFSSAADFNQPIGNWDVSNVIDMSGMFSYSYSFNHNISGWNVSNVRSMSRMFYGSNLSQPIGSWDVSNVMDMSGMFATANNFNEDISGWNTSSVTDMSFMFSNAQVFNQNLNNWNVSKVIDMNHMFNFAKAFNSDISGWQTNSLQKTEYMFAGASSFNQNIGGWNMSNVTDMRQMFSHATAFNGDIGSWNTANTIYMEGLFNNAASFNQNIGGWNVSNTVNWGMGFMFSDAKSFNQDLSNWCVPHIKNLPSRFDKNTHAWVKHKRMPVWGTCGGHYDDDGFFIPNPI